MKTITHKGFTLLEILLVITLLSIIAIIVVRGSNPNLLISRIQDNQRETDVLTIYQAIEQYAIKNNAYPTAIMNMPNDSYADICKSTATTCVSPKINLSSILVPTYISKIPEYSDDADNSGFYIVKDANGKIGVGGVKKVDNTTFVKGLDNQSFAINLAPPTPTPIPTPTIVQEGLVLHLDAGDTSSYPGDGTTWTDLSGNGNNVTLTNGPTYSDGSIVFDGIDDYISSVSIPNPNGELTFEVAMNYDSKGAYHNIFDRGFFRPMLWIDPNNKLEVSFSSASGGLTSNLAYNGQNIIVTAVYNSTSSPGIQLYVNGVSVGTNNNPHDSWGNPSTFTLFNRNNSQTFDGKLYYLKFYERALTPAEIQQNFNVTKSRFGL